ncbi:CBS domain-containing protein [Cystobacter fuscus]|uniref:CBS domain-containing protein n=1 Tax=Cystobacter fuscus TaxID=43 RepID=UPI002B28DA1C|nr:CBS domain-containing protein [Cystobacter fuscus]
MAPLPQSNEPHSPEERDRRAAESPPGSSERADSDVTGWSVERDEPPELRQGRLQRAAQMWMANPRTDVLPSGDASARVSDGPYGWDDRSLDDAVGLGEGPRMGDQDWDTSQGFWHPAREYRPWDRLGSGEPPSVPSELSSPTGHRRPREPLTAREVMTRQAGTVKPGSGLREVAWRMKEDRGIVPVVDEHGRLRGVVTERDLIVRVLAEGRAPDSLHAEDVMTDEVEAVSPHETLPAVIMLMGRHRLRRVPVVERDGQFVGIVSMADLATRVEHDEELRELLHHITALRSFWIHLD